MVDVLDLDSGANAITVWPDHPTEFVLPERAEGRAAVPAVARVSGGRRWAPAGAGQPGMITARPLRWPRSPGLPRQLPSERDTTVPGLSSPPAWLVQFLYHVSTESP